MVELRKFILKEDEMILNQETSRIREKYGDGIILFHTIGFDYECLAEDAHLVSKACGIELDKDGATNFCIVNPSALDGVISTLLTKGHKVAVMNRSKPRVFLPDVRRA
jgi:DNA mismatch repair ATPase MutS